MPYTDLIREWHAAVQAVDEKDWVSALGLLENISEPTSKIFFTAASVHLVLGQLEQAIKALDRTIAKDERLAVGFFQRGAVHMLAGRLEEALSDCSLALKHFRGNSVIDYRQLGLRYQLHSWQVLYNAAVVHTRLGQWDKALDFLEKAAGLTGEGRGVSVEQAVVRVKVLYNAAAVHTRLGQWDKALDSLEKAAGLTGEGRGVSVEQAVVRVKCRMLLEPLMVPKGEVFRPRKQDVEQLIQRDFLGKPKKASSFPNGIPLPPDLKPPTRPQSRVNLELPKLGSRRSSLADSSVQTPLSSERRPSLPGSTHQSHPVSPFKSELPAGGGAAEDSAQDSVIVKVHYTYTVAMRVSPETSYCQLQTRIREKLQEQQPPGHLQLRCRDSGSQALKPIAGDAELRALWERAEGGRTTVWCQYEDPLAGRPILYQVVALYDYESQGPEDLEFSKGDTIDILSEVNDEWLEGHTAGNIGIFPRCFIYQDTDVPSSIPKSMPT
ncbi:UNVERIFIED_CONTAM: hypothetical protein FKN15_074901 [Acipenser sinensis]